MPKFANVTSLTITLRTNTESMRKISFVVSFHDSEAQAKNAEAANNVTNSMTAIH